MIKLINVKSLHSALYGAVKFCKENSKEEIEIVVPDKLSLFMEKFLFEQMHIRSSFNIKITTLNRMAKKCCPISFDKQISKTGSILLIHKILNQNIDRLEVLKSFAYSFSYAEDVFKTIYQLKASKINFDEMEKFDSSNVQLAKKIKDLALIYKEYETAKAGLLDSSDLFLMSAFSVAEGRNNKKLLFVGFDDFTAIEYTIVERLALCAEVNILNYNSKSDNKYIYNSEVVSQMRNIAYINEIPFEIIQEDNNAGELKQFLEDNLFAFNSKTYTLNREIVKLYSGSNAEVELEFVARDIRSKILNGNRFDDFGVLVFGLENNIDKIKQIFEKYEINYYLDTEFSLNKSVLYKFIVSILKYNLEGNALVHIIDLINSPFFKAEQHEKKTIIQQLKNMGYRGKINNETRLNLDDDTKENLLDFFNGLTFEYNTSLKPIVEKIQNYLDCIDLSEKVFIKNDLQANLLIVKSKEIINSLCDEILKFNPDINAHEFLDIFTHISSVVKIKNLPLSIDAVKILDANNAMEIFNELYLVGANKNNAPALKYDCGIILDKEIEKLNFSHKLSPTIAHINRLAKLRLFNILSMFENELTITYSDMPSEIIGEMVNKLKVETNEGVINLVPLTDFSFGKYVALSQWDYIEFLCKKHKNNNVIDDFVLKNKEFNVLSEKNLKIYNDLTHISATTLENYFKCPLYAFLTNVLKIKPDLKLEILAFDIGNILHEIMFKYYKRKKSVGDVYEFCKTEVFNHISKDDRLKLNIDSPILQNLIDEAVRVVNAVDYIDSNSNFDPQLFEFAFEEKLFKSSNLSLVGKIDRIDFYNDLFRIVDYKSGKADASLKELYYGNKLQLFLYSCAMENVLKKRAVGAFYLPLHNAYTKELGNTYSLKGFYLAEDFVVQAFDKRLIANRKSDIVNVRLNKDDEVIRTRGYKELSATEFSVLKNYSKEVSERAIDEIKSGYVKPSPSGVSSPCEYCAYAQICMRKSNDIKTRDIKSVDLSSFMEVEDEGI